MTPRRLWLLIPAAAALLAPALIEGQAKKAGPGTLTAQDRLDIQILVSKYAYALDTGADNGYMYADLFAPDGEFVGENGSTKGRDALAGLGRLPFIDGHKPTYGVAHFVMNHVIEPSQQGATGKAYMILVRIGENNQPGGEFSNIGGHYEDVYTKTPQGWRFRRREFIPVKANPPAEAPASAPTAPPKAEPSLRVAKLTAQDYLDIRALANNYAYGLDTGADHGNLYASVFATDGEFHGPPATPDSKTPFDAKGRDLLRTFAVGGRGSAYVRHFVTNHLIEPAPEGARGKVYLLVLDIGQDGKATSVNMGGHYEDVYVKTSEGWKIKTRNFFRSKSAQTLQAEAAAGK
jgi:hypothetical protein